MPDLNKGQRLYRSFAVASFVTVFLLIWIGGMVRVTGSGMGCPDWPKCFGRWVPPTDVSQLPANYQEIYAHRGYDTMEFNAVKTWIEYLNRLFGALTGIVAFGFALVSLYWWKRRRSFTYMAFAVLFLVAFEGWLGARVVESNLNNYKITTHLMGALVILTLVVYAAVRSHNTEVQRKEEPKTRLNAILLASIGLLFAQIVLGTFVRAEMDEISRNIDAGFRAEWPIYAKAYLPAHRIFSLLVGLFSVVLSIRLWKAGKTWAPYKHAAIVLIVSLVGQFLTGALLNNFGFPAMGQLFHLGFSMSMFSAMVYALSHSLSVNKLMEKSKLTGHISYA